MAGLRTALADLLAQTKALMEGEKCDHSVGICYCDTFRAMDAAQRALESKEGVNKQSKPQVE